MTQNIDDNTFIKYISGENLYFFAQPSVSSQKKYFSETWSPNLMDFLDKYKIWACESQEYFHCCHWYMNEIHIFINCSFSYPCLEDIQ